MVTGNTNGNFFSRRANGSSNSDGNNNNSDNRMPPPIPPHRYGFHSFSTGAVAHNFINAALNDGSHTGIVTAATTMSTRGLTRSIDSLRASNGTTSGEIQSSLQIPRFGNEMNIHPMPPPPPLPPRAPISRSRRRPPAVSALMVVAEVHNPPQPPPRTTSLNGLRPSGLGNQSSQSSASSLGSEHSCECEECRLCVCHLFCQEHADLNCPIHGRGGRGHSSGSDDDRPFPSSSSGSEFDSSPSSPF